MSAATPLPDLIGRYRILDQIGRGSMGRVYRAHDPHTDRDVALKVLVGTSELTEEEATEIRDRFLIEARAAGRLSHPGIVLVYDADVDPATGSPFLAMELVTGQSLARVLRERGPLDWREAATIGAQVAAALNHAHERGIVHRDIKPGNVLIDDEGCAKVSDFGIAKFVNESYTLTGSVMGTPSYMAPEQLRGEPLDGRADLFGVGATLYEMLAGEPPFRGDTLATITHKVVYMDPRPLAFVRPDLPAEAEPIILRALAKHRAARFQTGRELAAALDATVDAAPRAERPRRSSVVASSPADVAHGPTEVLPPSYPGLPPTPRSRSWRAHALSARARRRLRFGMAAVLVAGTLGLGYWLGSRAGVATRPLGAAQSADAAAMAGGGPGATSAVESNPDAGSAAVPANGLAGPAGTPATAAPARSERETAALQLIFNNRLRHGRISVWVDRALAWTASLEARKDARSFVAGETVRATIPVFAGSHDIEVRIVQESAHIDSRGIIRGNFGAGRHHQLRVVLIPFIPKLKLDWEY